MSHAATAPAAPTSPDPNRAVSARLHSAGVAKILRTLFAYGRNLIATPRQEDDPADIPWYAFLTRTLGTTHPVLITVFIIRGLLRLATLPARLSSSLARLLPLPLRAWAAKQTKGPGRAPHRGPGRGQPRAAGRAITSCWPANDRLPTPQGGNVDRERPIGAILLDRGSCPP
jgi:hypothetical protein